VGNKGLNIKKLPIGLSPYKIGSLKIKSRNKKPQRVNLKVKI